MKVYCVPNPFFLADRFVFAHHETFGTVYIKLNGFDEIEEIGVDITKRMHNTSLEDIKTLRGYREANDIEVFLIEHIGEECWSHIHNMNLL